MDLSQDNLARACGVSRQTILKAKKKLGITNFNQMSKDEYDALLKEVHKTVKTKKNVVEKTSQTDEDFVPATRRIDQASSSSVADMLQDCKERYVKNEELIQRLQFEIDRESNLITGNQTGSLSCLPQLSVMEKFQKVNINLRNQIVSLEKELGRMAKDETIDDPFA